MDNPGTPYPLFPRFSWREPESPPSLLAQSLHSSPRLPSHPKHQPGGETSVSRGPSLGRVPPERVPRDLVCMHLGTAGFLPQYLLKSLASPARSSPTNTGNGCIFSHPPSLTLQSSLIFSIPSSGRSGRGGVRFAKRLVPSNLAFVRRFPLFFFPVTPMACIHFV